MKLEIDKEKTFEDELSRFIKMQLNGECCYNLATILKKDREADLVFGFKFLKNDKLNMTVKIY